MTDATDLYRRIEAECPAHQTRVAARALSRYFNAAFRELGITGEQFSLLVGIGGSDAPTIADLAERGGADATTLTRSVQMLERRELVRSDGGRGRRGKRLSLTSDGRRLLEQAVVEWGKARTGLSDAMRGFAPDDVRGVMTKLAAGANAAFIASDFQGDRGPAD